MRWPCEPLSTIWANCLRATAVGILSTMPFRVGLASAGSSGRADISGRVTNRRLWHGPASGKIARKIPGYLERGCGTHILYKNATLGELVGEFLGNLKHVDRIARRSFRACQGRGRRSA